MAREATPRQIALDLERRRKEAWGTAGRALAALAFLWLLAAPLWGLKHWLAALGLGGQLLLLAVHLGTLVLRALRATWRFRVDNAAIWEDIHRGGEKTVFAVILYTCFFPIAFTVLTGVRSTPLIYGNALRTLGAGYLRIVWDVVVPGAAPSIATGARLSIGYAWRAAIAGEIQRSLAAGRSRRDIIDGIASLRVRCERYRHVAPGKIYERAHRANV
jgi:succinate dehydrogenase/fumarate reductase cytochrome b subunit